MELDIRKDIKEFSKVRFAGPSHFTAAKINKIQGANTVFLSDDAKPASDTGTIAMEDIPELIKALQKALEMWS